ncbi:MAG: hypothetical protein K2N80_03650 [Lachnospiraceae bacterium]|nr:hypothetical protein [Lachnospiraceae bacterium]
MKTSVIFLAVYILVMTKGYINTVVQYKTGNYIEVEGVVQNYHFNIRNGNKKVIVYIEQMIPKTAIAVENRYIGKRKEKRNPDMRLEMNRNIPLEEII